MVGIMIVLFEENEQEFTSLGLGVLKDAISCKVNEKLNDEFTIEMSYPITGSNFSKIKIGRILFCKPNPYDSMQAFRIYDISNMIDGTITVGGVHISYDMNSIPIKAFSAKNMQDLITQIKNSSVGENKFVISSDIFVARTYKTTAPYNLRALLMGGDESILTKYDAEVKFNNYYVNIYSRRGKNRGAIVRYGHNMTDISHDVSNENLYNGVFPYYHTEKEVTETTTAGEFTKVYIVGSKPYQDSWFSYTKDGAVFQPVEGVPVQVATDGEYKDKVFVWDSTYNLYREKIYNQSVNLVQGVLEPSWVSIDWKSFPTIKCVAAKKGYFKLATDKDWGTLRGVGDVIFEGSIVDSGMLQNMVLFYSEIIPSKTDTEATDTTEVVDVQLDEGILKVDTPDTKKLKHDRILMLDLSSEFDEEPNKDKLKAKAEEYISKHKIGQLKYTTQISFIDLASVAGNKLENTNHIEIGDTVKVIYEDANVSTELRAISATYDVLAEKYEKIELGEKENTMTSSTIQTGDNVSALSNDVGYASITTVNKLIADIVTANYIEALNAKLSKAQIAQLEVEQINVKGIIQASQFQIDNLVAKLLTADNANIANTLTAGNIKVAGDIAVNSGRITITGPNGTAFIVDREGNVTANSVSITGGNLNINDGRFEVTNDGTLTATAANITGTINANDGTIGGFTITDNMLYSGEIGTAGSVFLSGGDSKQEVTIGESGPRTDWAFMAGNLFGVTKNGELYATKAFINSVLNAKEGYIANFKIEEDRIGTYTITQDDKGNKVENTYRFTSTGPGIYLGEEGLKLGDGFKVDTEGNVELNKGSINLGKKEGSDTYNFSVDKDGNVVGNSVKVTGGSFSIGENDRFKVTTEGFLTANNAYINGSMYTNGSILLGGSPTFKRVRFDKEAELGVAIVGYSALSSIEYVANEYYVKEKDSFGVYLTDFGPFDISKEYFAYSNGAAFYVNHHGELRINDDQFIVTPEGAMTAQNANIKGTITADKGTIGGWHINSYGEEFNEENGLFYAGKRFDLETNQNVFAKPGDDKFMILSPGTYNMYTVPNLINEAKSWFILASNKFGVDSDGFMYAQNAKIKGEIEITSGSLKIGGARFSPFKQTIKINDITSDQESKFEFKLADGFIKGTIMITILCNMSGDYGNPETKLIFSNTALLESDYILEEYNENTLFGQTKKHKVIINFKELFLKYKKETVPNKQIPVETTVNFNFTPDAIPTTEIASDGYFKMQKGEINLADNFKVNSEGEVSASHINITGGTINIGGNSSNPVFKIDEEGLVTSKNINIIGGAVNINNGIFSVSSEGAVVAKNIKVGPISADNDSFYMLNSPDADPNDYENYDNIILRLKTNRTIDFRPFFYSNLTINNAFIPNSVVLQNYMNTNPGAIRTALTFLSGYQNSYSSRPARMSINKSVSSDGLSYYENNTELQMYIQDINRIPAVSSDGYPGEGNSNYNSHIELIFKNLTADGNEMYIPVFIGVIKILSIVAIPTYNAYSSGLPVVGKESAWLEGYSIKMKHLSKGMTYMIIGAVLVKRD